MRSSDEIGAEIAALMAKLETLKAQLRAARLRESGIPLGVGTRVSHRGNEFEIARLDPAFAGAVQLYGYRIKKDGKPGMSTQYITLWSNGEAATGPFSVLEPL